MSQFEEEPSASYPTPRGSRASRDSFDTILENNAAAHGTPRSASSSIDYFSQTTLEINPTPDSFAPLASNKIVALPPANQQITRNNNLTIFDQAFSFRRLDWLIHDESLAQMLARDAEIWPPENINRQGNADQRDFVDGLKAPTNSLTLKRKTTFLTPWTHVSSLRSGLRRANLDRAETSRPTLSRQSSFFRRFNLRRVTTGRPFPTEARYVVFEKQRKKEARDGWDIFKKWWVGKRRGVL
jgi:hypothetical protein